MGNWIEKFLDATIVFSFDHSGFKRHCRDSLEFVNVSHLRGIITGASCGIGLSVAKSLLQHGMDCQLIGRNLEKLQHSFPAPTKCHSLDMSNLKQVSSFALNKVASPIDLLVHNAGSMPHSLTMTKEGFEEMFASQVLGPFIFTKILAELGKLREGCRIIFVSSGGMYLKKLDLSDLFFEKRSYNRYAGYANAKRAQVFLTKMFSKKYPQYLWSAMHPGWVDTPGIRESMPIFAKVFGKRLRSLEEGADTILWLATSPKYANGQFWFDRKQAKTNILPFQKSSEKEEELLWHYCQSIFDSLKGEAL